MADGRVDRRLVLRALLLAGAGLAVPAACGVPTGGGPIVDGTGPASDPGGGEPLPAPDPSRATSPINLVELFLAAVSGPLDVGDARRDALGRARKFLTPDASKSWQPAEQDKITVVRIDKQFTEASGDAGAKVVNGHLKPIGLLDERGEVIGYTGSTAWATVQFTVKFTNDPKIPWLIDRLPGNLPPGLILSSAALSENFLPQPIYFWDAQGRFLVPDLRYVPKTALSEGAQKAAVVKWLISGPSELLASVAGANLLPNGTSLLGPNVVTDPQSNAIVVNFSGSSIKDVDRDKVMAQLRWSLLPLSTRAVQLQIDSRVQQVDGSSNTYVSANPADASYRSAEPEAFCIAGGVVSGVDPPYQVPPVLIGSAHNQNVALAALSRDKSQVALVGQDQKMWIERLRDDAAPVIHTAVQLSGTHWSRPAWLPNKSRVLVIVDGTLYAVTTTGTVTQVNTGVADVTAFAVAPDGYRIALISDGSVSVGALREDGDHLSVAAARSIDPGLTDLSGVAWTKLDRVMVAGKAADGSGWGLAEVSIDGAILAPWSSFSSPIVSVVAYPQLPSKPQNSGQVMVQTNGQSHRAFPTNALALQPRQPSPGPSAGATSGALTPTAPFYLD